MPETRNIGAATRGRLKRSPNRASRSADVNCLLPKDVGINPTFPLAAALTWWINRVWT